MEATPYSFVYRLEAVLPMEVELKSLRIMTEIEISKIEWTRQREEP